MHGVREFKKRAHGLGLTFAMSRGAQGRSGAGGSIAWLVGVRRNDRGRAEHVMRAFDRRHARIEFPQDVMNDLIKSLREPDAMLFLVRQGHEGMISVQASTHSSARCREDPPMTAAPNHSGRVFTSGVQLLFTGCSTC